MRAVPRRLAAWPVLAVFAVAVGVALAWYAEHSFLWQPDDELFVHLGTWVSHHLPGSLTEYTAYQRGPQRLTLFLLAITEWLWAAPTALQAAKLVQVVLFVSTCFPIYRWGRQLGLRPFEALVPAALAILVPWATVSLELLTESIAYPVAVWTLYASWRTAVAPSPRRDLLAVATLGLAVLAKTSLAALFPVLPVVVLARAIAGAGAPGASAWSRWPRAGRDLVRQHAVLVGLSIVVVIGAVAFVVSGQQAGSSLFGVYGKPAGVNWHSLLHQSQVLLSRVVVGSGILVACLAAPWAVRQVVRPRTPGDQALAVVALTATVALLAATALIWGDDRPGMDERYGMYLAPLLFLAATRAVTARQVGVAGVVAASALVTWLVAGTSWVVNQGGDIKYVTYPAETFFARVVTGQLAVHLPGSLLGHEPLLCAIGAGVVAVALVTVVWRYPRWAGVAGAVVALGLIAYQGTQVRYLLERGTLLAGQRNGPGWDERSWVDRAVGRDGYVAILAVGYSNSVPFQALWRDLQVWNTRVRTVVKVTPGEAPEMLGDTVIMADFDRSTGRILIDRPIPDDLLVSRQNYTYGLSGRRIAQASYMDVDLIRARRPLQFGWAFRTGVEIDGFLSAPGRARLRVYTSALPVDRPGCVDISVLAPPGFRGPARYRVTGGARSVGGRLLEQQQRTLHVKLVRPASGPHFRDIMVSAPRTVLYPDGRHVGLRMLAVRPYTC
jgi:hypothetical protein